MGACDGEVLMAATDKALAGLRQMIASGELGPGEKFPPEPELCDHLGVSRSSLREAARSLAALGVIESRHGSGTYVSALDPAEIISRFSLSVELIPLEGVLQLLEVRRVLEAHATAAAAARQDPLLEKRLSDILDRLEATTDAAEIQALDAEFHGSICTAGGNPTVTALTGVIRGRGGHYRIFEPTPSSRPATAATGRSSRPSPTATPPPRPPRPRPTSPRPNSGSEPSAPNPR
jgi:GntR family transcriptional repressor for pyruvate dehydrogenase complex